MPTPWLQLRHFPQQHDYDCLATCAAMALAHLGLKINYDDLLKLLQVKPYGTPGRNLHYLTQLGVQVIYAEGWFDTLQLYLKQDYPCIILLRTTDLAYWSYSTDHAVLVVGLDNQHVYIHDPAFNHAPIQVPLPQFELAWMTLDYRYGVIIKNDVPTQMIND